MNKLYELKERLCEELEEYGSKDNLDVGALDVVDKLAHAIKNIDKIIENYEGYSGRSYGRDSYGDRYEMRRSYNDGSYRRGRGRNARRDSMGRYANDMMLDELRDMANDAPDEKTRRDIERLISSMEQ